MNREIKLRAWNKIKKEWLTLIDLPNAYHGENLTLVCFSPERFEIIQFIGLKDKNGKEIYEGDIVMAEDGIWSVFVRNLEDGIVLENQKKEECSIKYSDGTYCLVETEVIGNVMENPELLNQ